jgi:FkbM family methyltransferase
MIEHFLPYFINNTEKYVIFDVGSRDGLQSIEFYNHFPNAIIYCFECNPNTINICKKNIENYKDRIHLIEGAVCDYDGEITFYPINQKETQTTWEDGNPGASSIFKSNGTYTEEHYLQYEITTGCHRLDTVMKNYNIPKIDIIWMDLQGAELLALKSLGDYLKGVQLIQTKVSHKEIYSGQVMFNELHAFIMNNQFILKSELSLEGWQEDAVYEKQSNDTTNDNIFDIVIPVGPNDVDIIYKQIEYTKNNIIGYRNIYIISYDESFIIDGCITISESIFPFSMDTVSKFHGKSNRNGWYLQQLLKLYAGFVIPNISDKYLVIDSDTFFLKPTHFYKDNKCLYNYGIEYNGLYFIHMQKLHPDLVKMDPHKSGICHHMMFETKYVKELILKVQLKHSDYFYNVFLKNVSEVNGAGASEYEIYFNYMLCDNPNNIIIRPLHWKNTDNINDIFNINNEYDYISYHHYLRK